MPNEYKILKRTFGSNRVCYVPVILYSAVQEYWLFFKIPKKTFTYGFYRPDSSTNLAVFDLVNEKSSNGRAEITCKNVDEAEAIFKEYKIQSISKNEKNRDIQLVETIVVKEIDFKNL